VVFEALSDGRTSGPESPAFD